MVAKVYEGRPYIPYCMNCGQRFKYEHDELTYSASQDSEERMKELKMILSASSQPSLSDVMNAEAEREKTLADA
jgi:hypothetical protein